MDLKEIHDRIDFEISKEIDGYVSPEQKDLALDAAQKKAFSFLLGNEVEFSPQVPLSKTGYGKHQKIHNYLSPFKEEIEYNGSDYTLSNLLGTGPDGVIVMPENFLYLTGIYTSGRKRIKIVNEDELADHLDSEILRPTSTIPIAIFGGKGGTINGVSIEGKRKLQLFPQTRLALTAYILRTPAKPRFYYTMNGRIVQYDAALSTQMEWDDIAIEQLIIPRALEIIGMNLSDQEQTQYSMNKNATGI
jgi:hypothetical protein